MERKAFNTVSARLGRIMEKRTRMIEPMLTQTGGIYYNMQHMWPVHDARLDGKISDSDHDRLMVTDLIFRAYFQQPSTFSRWRCPTQSPRTMWTGPFAQRTFSRRSSTTLRQPLSWPELLSVPAGRCMRKSSE